MHRSTFVSSPAGRLARAAPLAAGLALVAAVVPAGQASAASAGCTTSGSQVTCVFLETGGAQTWTVPVRVTSAMFTLYGAEGGASSTGEPGGLGAEVTGTLSVTAGTVLQVNVGQAGAENSGATFGGGGPAGSGAGGGGGATDIRSPAPDGSYPVTGDVLAAAGGGGAGQASSVFSTFVGGPGGNADSPGGGGAADGGGGGGGAGTVAGPGGGGAGGFNIFVSSGQSGAPGGTGADQGTGGGGAPGAGGGGGGFYGGGGGGQGAVLSGLGTIAGNGGGGGGASYPAADVTGAVASPDDAPNGEVIITYTQPSLSGANLNGADLAGMYLGGANLSGANLNKADLTGANLAGANLSGANFNKADLTGADLNGATVTGTTNFNKVTWSNTTCPDGTNSNADGGTCTGHL